MNTSTRGMVESALMTAITVVLIIGSAFLPIIGAILSLVCAIPLTVVTVRQGPRWGMLTWIAATLLAVAIVGPISALAHSIQFLSIGYVFGWMFYHHKSGLKSITAGVIASMVGTILMTLISFGLMGFSFDQIELMKQNYLDDLMMTYEQFGMMKQFEAQGMSAIQAKTAVANMFNVMITLLPAILLITSFLSAIVNYLITVQILRRLKIRIPRTPSFLRWALPFHTIWGVIAIWAIWLASGYFNIHIPALNILIGNLVVICVALMFFQGLSVALYWFKADQFGLGMKIFSVIFFLIFFSGFVFACIMLGLGDLLFDFRKLRNNEKSV